MLSVPAPRDPALALHVRDFGVGLDTRDAPNGPRGAAIISENCDYFGRSLNSRRGYAAVLENGPGAVKIANFEPAEGWVGGSADLTNFVIVEAAATGTQGRSKGTTGPGSTSTTLGPFGATNLGTDALDVIHLWIRCTLLDAGVTGYAIRLRFQTSGGNYYEATLASSADPNNPLEVGTAKYHRVRRQAFVATGAPTWTSITQIDIFVDHSGTSGTVAVTVDNLHRTPGIMQALFQFERESGTFQGARTEYAITGGLLYRNDGVRWTVVTDALGPFDTSAPVYHLVTQDRVILSDGITTPRLLMSDGTTIYRLGIVTPPRTVVATQITGGNLTDGEYFVMVVWASSKTGAVSRPDLTVVATATITIAGGFGSAGIRFTNLPVSADPQVDWVRIGIRPATAEKVLFFPASDGAFGEVANGVTTYDFTGSISELLARSDHPIETDTGHPTVRDAVTTLPVEAHPLYLEQIGGYIVTVMSEQPTVVRYSRFREPTGWAEDDEQPVGENDSDPVTGIAAYGASVMVGKRTAVYWGRVVGGDEKIILDGPVSERGPLDHKGIVKMADTLWYRGQEGVMVIGLDQIPRLVSAPQIDAWAELWDPFGFGKGSAVRVRGREQVIHFGRRLGALWNDTGWCTHHRSFRSIGRTRQADNAVSLWDMPADVAAEVETPTGFEAWIGGNGQVWRINYGVKDDNRLYTVVHRTHLWADGSAAVCTWHDIDIESTVEGAFNLTVRPFIGPAIVKDSESAVGLKGQSDPLGEFVLGTSRLGAALYCHNKLRLPRIVARYMGLELEYRGAAELRIQRISAYYQPIGRQRGTTG